MFFFELEPAGSTLAYRKVDADNDLILSSDYLLSVNNGNNQWLITLPDPSGITGKVYIIKRYDSTSTNQIVITSASGLVQQEDGDFDATTAILTLFGTYSSQRMFMSNGTNWEYIK